MSQTLTHGSQVIAAAFGTALGASGLVVLGIGLIRSLVVALRRRRALDGERRHAKLSLMVGAAMTLLGVLIFASSLL